MFVASTTGDKWLVACVLVARASSDETTFAHVVTRVGPDGEPAVSLHYFLFGFEYSKTEVLNDRLEMNIFKSFLALCQALSADLTGDRIKNAAAGAAMV